MDNPLVNTIGFLVLSCVLSAIGSAIRVGVMKNVFHIMAFIAMCFCVFHVFRFILGGCCVMASSCN